jgi:hypothetical protein
MARRYEITAHAYDRRGRLLAVGRNSYDKTHPLQARLSERTGNGKGIYLHAEVAALLKARGKVYRLVVRREDKNGNPVPSNPCPSCRLAIEEHGVSVVEHS